MTDDTAAELEALEDLVQSRGFGLFTQMVRDEITKEFEEQVMRQFALPDDQIAVARARQVLAVRQAGERWLKLPKLKIEQLRQSLEQTRLETQKRMLPGRRPTNL